MRAAVSRCQVEPRCKNQSGAFDLPSVLIGVAVVAILAIGVMATVFGIIPWSQDRAAQQDLAAVNTAQGTTYAHAGSFTDKKELVDSGWLGEDTPAALDAKADAEGKCYVSVTTSSTGNRFVISSDKPTPRPLGANDRWCNGSLISPDTTPIMVSTWNTGLDATCQEISLPIADFKGTVNWGDGTTNTSISHTYTGSGRDVTITINGTFTRWGTWGASSVGDTVCIKSVARWGATGTANLAHAFYGAKNLDHVESIPSSTTDLGSAFADIETRFTLGHLDTSNVTNMRAMFNNSTMFNHPVDFDTSKVTNMEMLFDTAFAFNQPVKFNTANVVTMERMFDRALVFNHPVNFDTSNVTTMERMFNYTPAFNQAVHFNTPRLTNTAGMFSRTDKFNQTVSLDTSQVVTMDAMFFAAKAFNQPLNFDTAKVQNMNSMFASATAFNQPLPFKTTAVTSMAYMFNGAAAFHQDISSWEIGPSTRQDNAFEQLPAAFRPKIKAG